MQPPSQPVTVTSGSGAIYFKGLRRDPNKDHLIALSERRHARKFDQLRKTITPPSSWDSRTKGWVGPVKDQGQCGSCWDYSGTGVVEIAYYHAGIFKPDGSHALSEQYTLDCARNGGCNGDDNVTVLKWAKETGLPLTSDYGPYQGHSGRCQFKQSQTLYKIDDWGFCTSQGQGIADPNDIKLMIMAHGSVGAAIAADGAFSSAQAGHIFDRTTSQGIDHDIILVGWGDSATKVTAAVGGSGVSLPSSTTASNGWWWLRNSWSASWCDNGYCQIGWGINLVGTEACWAQVNAVNPPIDWVV